MKNYKLYQINCEIKVDDDGEEFFNILKDCCDLIKSIKFSSNECNKSDKKYLYESIDIDRFNQEFHHFSQYLEFQNLKYTKDSNKKSLIIIIKTQIH